MNSELPKIVENLKFCCGIFIFAYMRNFAVKSPVNDEADIKKKEESIMELGNMLAKNKRTQELRKMIENTRPFLVSLGKAKAAKLVRNLVDLCLMIDNQDGDIKVIPLFLEESMKNYGFFFVTCTIAYLAYYFKARRVPRITNRIFTRDVIHKNKDLFMVLWSSTKWAFL